MNIKFNDILLLQEKEDGEAVVSEKILLDNVLKELVNGEEIIAFCRANKVSPVAFFSENQFQREWPVLPIRGSEVLRLRKHTASQRPYFHRNDFYELIYVHAGSCAQTIRDISDRRLTLRAGEACLLEAGAIHAMESCGAGDVAIKVYIPRDVFAECLPRGISINKKDGCKIFMTTRQFGYFIFKLLDEQSDGRECREEAMKSYLTLLLIEAVRPPAFTDALLEARLNEYFEANAKTACLKDFARLAGYSEGYCARMIKRGLNENFSERLASFRLEKAARLLRETTLCVEEIAYRVGYKNASGLYKQINAFYGMTPKAYRGMFV